jgi:FkbM family methyltransferase
MFQTLRDYVRLRGYTSDAMELVRMRRRHRSGESLRAQMKGARTAGVVELRGGTQDVSVFFEIFARDVYRLAEVPSKLNTVVDLGGNVGLFAVRVAGMCERVLSFEPMPENFERLRANTTGLENVFAFRQAVGGHDGALSLYCSTTSRGTGRFSTQPQPEIHDASQASQVECISLDTLFRRHNVARCDLLKIDIEGSEYDVLLKAPDDVLARIDRIHGEYHPANDRPDALNALRGRLEKSGFRSRFVGQARDTRYGMFFANRIDRAFAAAS